MADQVRWFEQHPKCWKCGSTDKLGILRGPQNESYGSYCRKCADARLKAAERERAKESRAKAEEAVRPNKAQANGILPRGDGGAIVEVTDDAASRLP